MCTPQESFPRSVLALSLTLALLCWSDLARRQLTNGCSNAPSHKLRLTNHALHVRTEVNVLVSEESNSAAMPHAYPSHNNTQHHKQHRSYLRSHAVNLEPFRTGQNYFLAPTQQSRNFIRGSGTPPLVAAHGPLLCSCPNLVHLADTVMVRVFAGWTGTSMKQRPGTLWCLRGGI